MHHRWVAVHPAVLTFTAAAADMVTSFRGNHDGEVHRIGSLPYLIRMRLFDHVRVDPGQQIHEHEAAGCFIPISRIKTSDDLSRFIVDMIPLLHATPQEVEPIRYVISELVRNVLEHAHSDSGAFVAAQYYSVTKTLALGVCDAGIGIKESLSLYHTVSDDWSLVQALRPGITGASPHLGGTAYNAGAGLFFTKSIACASRNYFVVYSGDALFKLKPAPVARQIVLYADPNHDHHTREIGLPSWRGTLVGIDVSLGEARTFANLMGLIRRVFGATVRSDTGRRLVKPQFT